MFARKLFSKRPSVVGLMHNKFDKLQLRAYSQM